MVTRSTPLAQLDVPTAIIRGVAELFPGMSRRGEVPTVDHLTRCNVMELLSMDYVGVTKINQARAALAQHGYTLAFDPPLPDTTTPALTPEQAARIRRKARAMRRFATEIIAELSVVDEATESDEVAQ